MQSQKQFKRRFSFEFFPPKTDQGKEKLQNVRNQLAEVKPRQSGSEGLAVRMWWTKCGERPTPEPW